jgi:hypothetical protein
MALWTGWPCDNLPQLRRPTQFTVGCDATVEELALLTSLSEHEINRRIQMGNVCYITSVGGAPVAYGWVATAGADIGELELLFRVDSGNSYLWDFQTLPEWRGRGFYPLLLQAILTSRGSDSQRFWIITAPENRASARGIEKAGFTLVAELAFTEHRRAGVVGGDSRDERALTGAKLLGLPLLQPSEQRSVSPCWCCVIDAVRQSSEAVCWISSTSGSETCNC